MSLWQTQNAGGTGVFRKTLAKALASALAPRSGRFPGGRG